MIINYTYVFYKCNSYYKTTYICICLITKKYMKKLPKDQHKKRVLLFIEPEVIEILTKEICQSIGKEAIRKAYRKQLRNERN